MNLVCWLLGLLFVLSGCQMKNEPLDHMVSFRETLLSSEHCSFQAEVTADYGDAVHQFTMDCQGDTVGNLEFEILQPETISGIRGNISDVGGYIEFDDRALYFPLLTDDLLSPASAPWIFLKTLRSGYIRSACIEGTLLHVTIDDSYAEDALTLDIWMESKQPVRVDILHDGKRILSLNVESFSFS